MIYFDNSATSHYKPKCVLNSVKYSLENYSVNVGRSSYNLAIQASKIMENTRENLINFFNANSAIFTFNCTAALNLGILGTIIKNGHVITSINEHNSILRPLNAIKEKKLITIEYIEPDENGLISAQKVKDKIRQNTYMIALNHISNVTGGCADIYNIGQLAFKNNILFLLDAAQSAGYINIDMKKNHIDMLAIAPHKGLHSIQGIGALMLSKKVKLNPITFGGTGISSMDLIQPTSIPEGFEVGTLPIHAIIALNKSLYWTKKNMEQNQEILKELSNYTYEQLNKISNIRIYSTKNDVGIISFLVDNFTSSETSNILNKKYNIATRSGLHCAPLLHKYLHTEKSGLTRISLGIDNTQQEIDYFLEAIKNIY